MCPGTIVPRLNFTVDPTFPLNAAFVCVLGVCVCVCVCVRACVRACVCVIFGTHCIKWGNEPPYSVSPCGIFWPNGAMEDRNLLKCH